MVKLIGNTLISFMLEGLCEGLVVAKKAGVDPEKMLEVVMASGFAVALLPVQGHAPSPGATSSSTSRSTCS